MRLRSSLATLFVGLLSFPLTMCSSDDSGTSNPSNSSSSSNSSDSCSCKVTVNGTGKDWSGCGNEVCIGGITYECSTTGATKKGDCDENDDGSSPRNPDPSDPDPSDPDPSDPDPSDPSTPKDAGPPVDPTPSCDVSKTFTCGSAKCTLDQICVSKDSLCFNVEKEDQCTPCSTQYGSTKIAQCPKGYIPKLSGSGSTGCTVQCQ